MATHIHSVCVRVCVRVCARVYTHRHLLLDDALDHLTRMRDVINLLRNRRGHNNHTYMCCKVCSDVFSQAYCRGCSKACCKVCCKTPPQPPRERQPPLHLCTRVYERQNMRVHAHSRTHTLPPPWLCIPPHHCQRARAWSMEFRKYGIGHKVKVRV